MEMQEGRGMMVGVCGSGSDPAYPFCLSACSCLSIRTATTKLGNRSVL